MFATKAGTRRVPADAVISTSLVPAVTMTGIWLSGMRMVGFCAAAVLAAMFLCAAPAIASMHDKETCKALMLERSKLLSDGIEENMINGPYWAQANLDPEQIKQIAHYLDLDETIMFRCRDGRKPKIKSKIVHTAHKKKVDRRQTPVKKVTAASFNPFDSD